MTVALSQPLCMSCGATVRQSQGSINRAVREGKPLYCDRVCAGLARRVSSSYKKRKKALYDTRRRTEKAAEISAQKRAYYQRTRDPEKERERRRANMERHVEYCRQPEYKADKAEYDRWHRAKEYGPYSDAYLLLLDLEREIRSRATSYERYKARGYYTRTAQQRRRELWLTTGN
jgi:hypothetical protein